MAKLSILAGATSQTVNVFIQNSSSTTGAGLTGLVYNTSGLTAYYVLPRAASAAITLATLVAATSAYSSGGFKEIDATNAPGLYRLDIPNAALAAASGRFVTLYLQGATNMAPLLLEIELTGWDNQDAVHGGLSALPNTACTTNASLLTSGTGTDQISNTSGRVDVGKALGTAVTLDANNVLNVSTKYLGGTLQTARDIGLSVLLSSGTGTGQLSLTSGTVQLSAITHTGARIPNVTLTDTVTTYTGDTPQTGDSFARIGLAGVGLTNLGDTRVANLDATVSSRLAPAGTLAVCTLVTTATNLTNTPGAGDFTAAMKTSLNAATPASVVGAVGSVTGAVGSVTGAVGSVTGAVGSVTGNVGGNVTGSVGSVVGSVGSVVGAVGSVTGAVGSVTGAVGSVTGSVGSVTADVGITQAAADKVFGASGAALAELAQAQPSATPSAASALMLLYMALRNNLTTTASTKSVYNNAGVVISKKALADDGTTYTETKMVTGP